MGMSATVWNKRWAKATEEDVYGVRGAKEDRKSVKFQKKKQKQNKAEDLFFLLSFLLVLLLQHW